ncbi:type IV pilus secretin PilQ [Candidatus Methylocalor cossyra]|uniref:Fimbrial assembly protein PilQ n=1 Tax=Candidatus Methylocalor cossyra TaxID=3108543 RepID=A0ABP1C8Z4_9GAMM
MMSVNLGSPLTIASLRKRLMEGLILLSVVAVFPSEVGLAAGLVLESVDFSSLAGDSLQLVFRLSGPATEPRVFHTENPARIALDLPGVSNGLKGKSIPVNTGKAQSIQAVESAGRTRVVIHLADMVPYSTRTEGNHIVVTLQGSPPARAVSAAPLQGQYAPAATIRSAKRIENIDFRRGERGEGRVLISLSDPRALADIRQEGRRVVVRFGDAELPSRLARRLDVTDFATPVQFIESTAEGAGARMVITPVSDDFDYSSYQSGKLLTVEFRPLSKAEKEEIKRKSLTYTGEKLTMNFQDIPVRSVLQILADFTHLNIVASDSVQGNVTLRLQDVPWDQALELVLKSKGLGKRQEGNIIRVAPLEELNKQEEDELKAQKVVEDLEPLRTEIIQINYTTAEEVKKILIGTTERTNESASTTSSGAGGQYTTTSATTLDVSHSILSARGNVTVDPRTNQLIVKDTPRNLERIRDLVRRVDKPVRQVLIESRIVIANNNFTRELGSRLSLNRANFVQTKRGKQFTQVVPDPITGQLVQQPWQQTYSGDTAISGDALVDLASTVATASGGSFGVTFLKVGEYLLDLELSAGQIENRAEIVSTPKLITADQTQASIKQGFDIPYQSTVVSGGGVIPQIQFKEAVLELKVTPHITPDDNILMDLHVTKNTPGQTYATNVAIDKREINTQAQVGNGETVVLGGVYEGTQLNQTDKVPFLGDLPGVGFMFRKDHVEDTKRELLIFITPKILDQALAAR